MTEEDVPELMIQGGDFAGMTKLQIAEALTKIAARSKISSLIEFLDLPGIVCTPENEEELRKHLIEVYVVRQMTTLETLQKFSIPEL